MTANRGVQIGFVVATALIVLIVILALALGGGDDGAGAGAGGEPAPAGTEAGALPAELLECLEQQGLDPSQIDQLGTGVPPGPEVHDALPACGQFLPEGAGPPPGAVPGAP